MIQCAAHSARYRLHSFRQNEMEKLWNNTASDSCIVALQMIRRLMCPAQQSYISIAIVSSGNSNNAQRKFNKFRVGSGPRSIPCRYDCMRVKLCCKYSNQTFANAFNHLAPTFDAVPLSLDSIHLHRQSLHNAHECTRKTVLAMLLVLLTMTFYVIISTYFIGLSTRRSINISFEYFLFALQCI